MAMPPWVAVVVSPVKLTVADPLPVVADGAVVEDGAPSELAARDTAYASMLRAEREVLAEAWSPEAWRVVRVGEGAIREEAS